jgi:hypothetical protein
MLVDVTVILSLKLKGMKLFTIHNFLTNLLVSLCYNFNKSDLYFFGFKPQLLVVFAKNSHVGGVKYLTKKITYP